MAATVADAPALTHEQIHALFDILTHHETYKEIEGFKFPDAVRNYGFPFTRTPAIPIGGGKSATATPAGTAPSTPRARTPVPPEELEHNLKEEDLQPSMSPVLQTLLTRFVLPLPGLRDMPREFWAMRVQGLLARLGEAELSDSYDKGAVGTRKTLATGASGLIEMIGRGALGGVTRPGADGEKTGDKDGATYDHKKGEDLERAWNDIVQGLVYGDLVDEMSEHLTKTDDLEGRSPAVKAAAEYAIIQYVSRPWVARAG